ncbi:MAG TPA: DUF3231 family protein [Desulfosporosinus sp.]|nr:DUF3231 family protein [Desulfosporosinus sp.]
MDLISIFKKTNDREDRLDIQEAFNIYNLLSARYFSMQTIQLYKNLVHDVDWEIILDGFMKHFDKQIAILEELGLIFRIKMPNRSPMDVKASSSINDITDDYIYKDIFHDLVAQLMSLIYAVHSSSTNDKIRNVIIQDLTTHLKDFDILYKFGKLKGWEATYPVYKTTLHHQEEALSTSEAFHIWDHINMRYEQIELIGLFSGFAHDTEFKVILDHGLDIFNKQVSHLEQLALKLNVPLPNRPTLPVIAPIDPEIIMDMFMYRNILNSVLTALDTHVRAIIETIRNDSLRTLWIDQLNLELKYYDTYLKYGKMKGWTRVVPIYGEPVT